MSPTSKEISWRLVSALGLSSFIVHRGVADEAQIKGHLCSVAVGLPPGRQRT